ncbi:cytochrome c oxidase assembly protein COX15 homolog [Daktulosphaira vitifoliae]|uniref:cytochrome c oxidase assembly protein COX15 homolog n=1 Tax=Daktulosphaira vitifoliae TaxID=58002 RepID=UPI0021A9EBC8|nr:cytochrome c oxidase assembly protein COX15 homolog [Daktulosphaira vitifoliae]
MLGIRNFFYSSCSKLCLWRIPNMNKLECTISSQSRYIYKSSLIKKNIYSNIWKRHSSNIKTIETDTKFVGYWFLGCSGMVFVAVALGGVTRLTESGLSMVHWKLLGEKLPTTQSQWDEEFNKYQQYPEFKMINSRMTVEEFKWIWWMEYAHRTWGRCIGAAFFIPMSVLWLTRKLSRTSKINSMICSILLAGQGLMGWYMVKSGLENRFDKPTDVPRVSQYRLASHLGLAFILYSFLLTNSLRILLPVKIMGTVSKKIFRLSIAATGIVFLTAMSGAFVAGLDAGLVYNSFPKMGDNWIPDDILNLDPIISNVTENPTTVQFNHRILGMSTVSILSALYIMSQKSKLPPRAKTAVTTLAIFSWCQMGLGLLTLLTYVPTYLAAAHQSGSLTLLSLSLWLIHELKKLPRVK